MHISFYSKSVLKLFLRKGKKKEKKIKNGKTLCFKLTLNYDRQFSNYLSFLFNWVYFITIFIQFLFNFDSISRDKDKSENKNNKIFYWMCAGVVYWIMICEISRILVHKIRLYLVAMWNQIIISNENEKAQYDTILYEKTKTDKQWKEKNENAKVINRVSN